MDRNIQDFSNLVHGEDRFNQKFLNALSRKVKLSQKCTSLNLAWVSRLKILEKKI